jgi:hypothetical protein
MKTQGKSGKLAVLAVMGSVLVSLATLAAAESDAARAIRASAATVPTNIPGIRTYADPPKGFDPVMASDEELATYGFPPRPDKQAHPDQYARWERVMKAAKIHWNGELKALPHGEHGMMPAGSSPVAETLQPETSGPKRISTNNASGVIVSSGQKTFTKNSMATVFAEITVPTVELPSGTTACTGQGYEVISSVGIDGFVFNTGNGYEFDPQLQGGVFEQIACSGDVYYFAVTGWQGSFDVAFEVNPGDVVSADAFIGGESDGGTFLEDLTTGTFLNYFAPVTGMVGATATWTVERMCCSGNEPLPLPNTVGVAFGFGSAETESDKFYYPGSQASSTELLTMTDDAGGQNIETVTQGSAGAEGLAGLWFDTAGCASSGGCTP